MAPKLSIIIPCYNCEKTLLEAVKSCYTQGFASDDFEIVLVDDASTDGTGLLLKNIKATYPNITLLTHQTNQGGGAARNTAVSKTLATTIFCLDSDDVLPPQTLIRMYTFLCDKKLDGVLFAETRFFSTNFKNVEIVPNSPKEEIVSLNDLFNTEAGFLTQVNFMYTKNAFSVIGGYPTAHGFDTQTFGLGFLAKSLKASVCPNTFYYHRQNQTSHKSYYEREYEQGLISINSYLALEPILSSFHNAVIEMIISFDIFNLNYHGQNTNLRAKIVDYAQSGKPLLTNQSETYSDLSQSFIEMISLVQREKYSEALTLLGACLAKNGSQTPLLLYMYLRISEGLIGHQQDKINKSVVKYLTDLGLLNRPRYLKIPTYLKPLYKIYRHFKR
ncbi:MAG: glycosyltransferase family 2 protein [Candidatus Paceibacterota bacterium]